MVTVGQPTRLERATSPEEGQGKPVAGALVRRGGQGSDGVDANAVQRKVEIGQARELRRSGQGNDRRIIAGGAGLVRQLLAVSGWRLLERGCADEPSGSLCAAGAHLRRRDR